MNVFSAPLLLGLGLLAAGCQSAQKADTETAGTTDTTASATATVSTVGSPVLLNTLPDQYNTPDGLAEGPDAPKLVLGKGAWRWSDLVSTRR